ncbi:unnamed protein product [Orchesella dallaii]|uniref:Uncharacterized protein n=1 Tax=Orchesella dallaii TaxID=48710 RepID=A0ABP1QQ44_9HEXA
MYLKGIGKDSERAGGDRVEKRDRDKPERKNGESGDGQTDSRRGERGGRGGLRRGWRGGGRGGEQIIVVKKTKSRVDPVVGLVGLLMDLAEEEEVVVVECSQAERGDVMTIIALTYGKIAKLKQHLMLHLLKLITGMNFSHRKTGIMRSTPVLWQIQKYLHHPLRLLQVGLHL